MATSSLMGSKGGSVIITHHRREFDTVGGPGTRVRSQWTEYCFVTKGFGLGSQELEVWRRFSDFAALHAILVAAIPGAILPTLPEKVTSNLQRTAAAQADYLQKRALALNAYLVALLSNGAALCEKTPVLNLLRAFLSGTKLAWQEAKAYAQNLPELKGKGAGGEGSDAAAAPDESSSSPSAEPAGGGSGGAKKSSAWGFKMPAFAVPSMMSSSSKNEEVKACAVMTDDDAALDKIGQETKDWLAAVVDADKKARALAKVDGVVLWGPLAAQAASMATKMGGTTVLAAGIDSPVAAAQQAVAAFLEDNKSASKEAKLQAAAEAEAQGDAAKAAALRAEVASSKVDADSQWLLAPLVVLLAHQARTAAPDAKAHYERRNLCAASLVKHVKTLHATKAALAVRAKVRKDWVNAVKLHATKKDKANAAADNPKVTAEAKAAFEAEEAAAGEAKVEAAAALDAATKRFMRDYELNQKNKVALFKDFLDLWTKIHRSHAKNAKAEWTSVQEQIMAECQGASARPDLSLEEQRALFVPPPPSTLANSFSEGTSGTSSSDGPTINSGSDSMLPPAPTSDDQAAGAAASASRDSVLARMEALKAAKARADPAAAGNEVSPQVTDQDAASGGAAAAPPAAAPAATAGSGGDANPFGAAAAKEADAAAKAKADEQKAQELAAQQEAEAKAAADAAAASADAFAKAAAADEEAEAEKRRALAREQEVATAASAAAEAKAAEENAAAEAKAAEEKAAAEAKAAEEKAAAEAKAADDKAATETKAAEEKAAAEAKAAEDKAATEAKAAEEKAAAEAKAAEEKAAAEKTAAEAKAADEKAAAEAKAAEEKAAAEAKAAEEKAATEAKAAEEKAAAEAKAAEEKAAAESKAAEEKAAAEKAAADSGDDEDGAV